MSGPLEPAPRYRSRAGTWKALADACRSTLSRSPGETAAPEESDTLRRVARFGQRMTRQANGGPGIYAPAPQMSDLVDRIRAELDARIRELRPIVRELERLEHAAAALARAGARSVPGLRSRVAAPRAKRAAPRKGKAGPATAKPKAGRVAQKRRTPAPRGQTRAKVLEALAAAPGSSSAAVAKAAGIAPSVAAATISRLVKQGRVRRLDEGGYVVVESPADDLGEAPASAVGADNAAAERPSAVEAPGKQPPSATAQ